MYFPIFPKILHRVIVIVLMLIGLPCVFADESSLSAPGEGTIDDGGRPQIDISAPAPKIVRDDIRTISNDPAHYLGWPTLTRRKDGELLLVYSGGRDYHVCPFGRIEMMRSSDGGATWSPPQVILDTALDDRGASVIEAKDGTILVAYISSKVYQKHLNNPERLLNKVFGKDVAEHLARWHEADQRTTPEEKRLIAGEYKGRMTIRSTDGGKTWSDPMPVPFFSPRGPIRLDNGNLLFVGGDGKVAAAYHSADNGLTWSRIALLPTTAGEAHVTEAADGSIVAHVREKRKTPTGRVQETVQAKSRDGGKTWSPPRKVADGYPSNLLRLNDGTLLMTYGIRKKPDFGIRARLSRDNGESWSEEIIISDEGETWDIGYPSTVQLSDGRLVTVWYEAPKEVKNAEIKQAVWHFE